MFTTLYTSTFPYNLTSDSILDLCSLMILMTRTTCAHHIKFITLVRIINIQDLFTFTFVPLILYIPAFHLIVHSVVRLSHCTCVTLRSQGTLLLSSILNFIEYMRIYFHTYLHMCIRSHITTYKPTYLHSYVRSYIRAYLHTYMHTCLHTYLLHAFSQPYIRAHTFVHTHLDIYIHIHILPTYTPTYIHTFIHTYHLYSHIHTYIPSYVST